MKQLALTYIVTFSLLLGLLPRETYSSRSELFNFFSKLYNAAFIGDSRGPNDINLGTDSTYTCPGVGVFPHPECNKYYTCYLGESNVLYQCEQDWLFDLRYNGCNYPYLTDCGDRIPPGGATTTTISTSTVTPSSTTTRPPSTASPQAPVFQCPTEAGFFPISPEACTEHYYACASGVPYILTCPNDLLFDSAAVSAQCRPAAEASCRDQSLKCAESAGFYGIPGACSAVYYVCAEGLVTEKICPGGSVFDSDKNVCAPVQSVPCANSVTTTTTVTTVTPTETTTSPSTTTPGSTTTKGPGGPFVCPGNGNYDDPDDDCERYYYCVSGVPYPSYCNEGICFDPVTSTCHNFLLLRSDPIVITHPIRAGF